MQTYDTLSNQLGAGSPSTFQLLPPEMIFEISHHLPRNDLNNLALTCKFYFSLIKPVFDQREPWASKCNSFEECEARLDEIISTSPTRRAYIRRLVLRPSYNIEKPTPEILTRERKLGEKLQTVLPFLPSLRAFLWDGFETLDEAVWSVLRESCPKICYLGTSVGALGISGESKIFTFSDLLGFRFFSKFQDKPLPSTFQENIYPLPVVMWIMLLERCPRLHRLELGGQGSSTNTQLFDVRPLVCGRWPDLRELTLGHTLMMDRDAVHAEDEKFKMSGAFSCFLTFHKSLELLHLPHGCRYPPIDLRWISLSLKSFRGTFHYFDHYISQAAQGLEELFLTEEEHGAWYMPHIRPVLKNLRSLRRLTIHIDLFPYHHEDDPVGSESRETDHMVIFRRILADCPGLEHVSFITSADEATNFAMKDLPEALADKPEKLRIIEVLKMDNGKEENMFKTTVEVLRQCPSLDSVTLCYTRDSYRHWRPKEILRQGTYSVERDSKTGYPKALQATEIEVLQEDRDWHVRECNYPVPSFEEADGPRSLAKLAKARTREVVNKGITWAMVNSRYRQKVKIIRNGWQRRGDYYII